MKLNIIMSWKPATEPSRFPEWVPGRLRGPLRWFLKWGLVALVLLVAISLFYFYLSWQYDIKAVAKMPERSVILDRKGAEFGTIHGDRRRMIERSEIPDVMVEALYAREDARFLQHHGVDTKGLVRATLRNIKDMGFTQGASTLTMQLTRNSYDLRAKSIHRKLLEIAVTLRIERTYTKDEILTHYLNRIYFGAGCHGVEEAAQTYFGRPTKELNIGECAMLVGIIRGPHLYSPFRNMKGALVQRDEVLARMVESDFLSAGQMPAARSAPIRLVPEKERHKRSSYAKESIRKQLDIILDKHDIRDGGLRIYSTLDSSMQKKMEQTMVSKILPIEQNGESDLQAAALRIDPRSGGILAICGGRDYSVSPYNRGYLVRRDLGPMFTPFLQAIALERAKVVIPASAVQTGRQLGIEETTRLSKRLGFSGPFAKTEDLYRGIIASSPMELACAASTLVAKGEQYEAHLISKITDTSGEVLYKKLPSVSQVLSKDAAGDALAILAAKGGVIATPTGSRHDAWAVCFKKDQVSVLWFGYDKAKTIADRSSITEALSRTIKSLD